MADEQKIMLLTGASRGIGHATVKVFQERGWRLLTVSRYPFSEECRWPAARESHVQADLTDLESIDELAAKVRARLPNGRLHALVNNAGISPKAEGGARLGVLATDAATWMHVLNVNLVSIALLVRALVNELEAGQGSIVNVASIAGSRVHPFAGVAYAASKAGVVTMTKSLARALAPGVRVNVVLPGFVRTRFAGWPKESFDAAEKITPLRQLASVEDVAEAALFFAAIAKSTTGESLVVDGGMSTLGPSL